MIRSVQRAILGAPLPTIAGEHERLSRPAALASFGLDALSSVAYAPQEILFVLIVAGSAASGLVLPISLAIVVLLAVVTISYRQTIMAYPRGGGSYTVARENLGVRWGLVAAAALTVDYLLVVAVSTTAGVAELTSAFPALLEYRTHLAVGLIGVMVLVNLRGVRESGAVWAIPTYVFIAALGVLIALGLGRWQLGLGEPLPVAEAALPPALELVTIPLLLRAFAGGCTALTGIEAIANGVPVFKPPESRNAVATLSILAVILAVLFLGIAALAGEIQAVPTEHETVISQVAEAVFGRSPAYLVVQLSVTVVLILAANTGFNGFPVLAAALARDGFMPRQLANRGDRLGYSNGVIVLGLAAAALVVGFGGDTHALIPLFAVGVFISFTVSQAGMAVHWRRLRTPGWLRPAAINTLGGVVTLIATIVILEAKFIEGAWIVALLLPVLVWGFLTIRHHYDDAARELTVDPGTLPRPRPMRHTVIVPIARVDRTVAATLAFAVSLSDHVIAVHVTDDPEAGEEVRRQWRTWGTGIQLVILRSLYRHVVGTLVEYVELAHQTWPDESTVVVLPESVPGRWWQHALHNQTTLAIKAALLFQPGIVVTSVPFHLEQEAGTAADLPTPHYGSGISKEEA